LWQSNALTDNKLTLREPNIAKLLNDESFIRRLKDEATTNGQQKRERWLTDRPPKRTIIEKAKKIVSMPFAEYISPDMEKKLQALKKEIKKIEKLE
jgi:hypothetical protein